MYYRKKRKKRIPIIIAILLLVLAGYFAASRLLPESAATFYLKAEEKNSNKILETINKHYISFVGKYKPFLETAYRRRTEITVNIRSGADSIGLKNERLLNFINKSKLIIDTRRRPKDGTSLSEADLLVEKSPFLGAELFTEKGMLYFTVPVLMPGKYFSTRLDRLGNAYDKFSIPVKPEKVISGISLAEVLKFDKDQLSRSASRLVGIFKKYVTKDAVKYGQEKELLIAGQKVKGKEVLVNLDEKGANSLVRELAAAIVEDDTLLDFTYGNIAGISELLDDAGFFRLIDYLDRKGTVSLTDYEKSIVNGLNFKKNLDDFKKELLNYANGYRLKNGLEMSLVIDKDGNILDRRLLLDFYDSEMYRSFTLDVNTGCSNIVFDDGRNRFVKFSVSEYNTKYEANGNSPGKAINVVTEFQIVPYFNGVTKNGTLANLAMHFAHMPEMGGKSGFDLDVKLSESTDAETLKRNRVIGFTADVYGEAGNGKIAGECSIESWENSKTNSVNSVSNINVDINLPFLGISNFSAAIKLAGEDRLGIGQFPLPDMRDNEVIDIDSATDEDIGNIKMELMASFGTFYLQNKSVIDALLGL